MADVLSEIVLPEDLKKFEKIYHEQLYKNDVTPKAQFEYAWCLVRSKYPADIQKGIMLLEELYKTHEEGQRDYLYYLAIGSARLKEYSKALSYVRSFLSIEPGGCSSQAVENRGKHFLSSMPRKAAIDDIAVKPITQFPVSLAEEASEEQFSASYPNVRTVALKKQSNQSLGIMIIEGKHAEVGQGIFISDIQEGSSAEKAGLEIGELILAVNKDSLVGSNYETAANLLKRTEGLVTLVVSNPGKKESASSSTPTPTISSNNAIVENNKNALSKPSTLKPSAPSRPTTPVPEPIADPLTCPINLGRDTTIEIVSDNKSLGIFFVGGKDTLIPNGIVVVEVYPGGVADKDKRLQPGDNILDVNGTSLKDVSYTTALQALRQTLPKMKMIIYRPTTIEYTTVEADLIKKPGKGLGISVVARKAGKGVYIADIISGGTAELDGRLAKGDLLISVNGQNLENATGEEAGAILKTVTGKVSLKLSRYKPSSR